MSHHEVGPAVALVVHDVAPRTWPECAQLLQMLDDLGARPVTILVVPHYHYRDPIAKDARFIAALDRRLARGDELALHGFHHRDDEPPPRTLRGFVERRMLTRAEGEFAALNEASAAWRLAHGIEAFRALRYMVLCRPRGCSAKQAAQRSIAAGIRCATFRRAAEFFGCQTGVSHARQISATARMRAGGGSYPAR